MANDHSTYPLNLSLDFFDDLNEVLSKANALTYIALSNQFFEAEQEIMSAYLWQVNDLTHKAKMLLNEVLASRSHEK